MKKFRNIISGKMDYHKHMNYFKILNIENPGWDTCSKALIWWKHSKDRFSIRLFALKT